MSSDLSSNPSATGAGSPAPGGPVQVVVSPAPGTGQLNYATPGTVNSVKSPWSPLAVPAFKALWLAYLISLIGTWAREAGGPWLMEALKEKSPDTVAFWVSLIQPAGTLPICLLSISAGVFADIYDRRKLLIYSNIWMLVISTILGIVTLAGATTPPILLGFTLLLGVGAALAGPAFQYVIPELVPPSELPLAIGLNSVALNVARAVGPVLGMLIILLVGRWAGKVPSIGASFLVNAAAFVGVIWVLARWERGDQKRSPHPETLGGATTTAFRYTAHSPAMRAILVRVAGFILCAVIVWAQLPIMAKQLLHGQEWTYMLLMGAVGAGAVIGVIFMPKMDKRFSTEGMVVICTIAFGVAMMLLSLCHGPLATLWVAAPLMMVVGFNWVIVPTNFNIATQRSVPGWVKGRAIAMYMTVLFGSFAVGSPIWGAVSSKMGIANSLLISGALVAIGALLAIPFPLTRARGHDFTPANRPAPGEPPAGLEAMEMVLAYQVDRHSVDEFTQKMHQHIRGQRLRNGATGWRLIAAENDEDANGTVTLEEKFCFASWSDRMRFHARMTSADAAAEAEALRHVLEGPSQPLYRPLDVPSSPTVSSRRIPHPPPMINWDHIATRFIEELGTMINRIMDAHSDRDGRKK